MFTRILKTAIVMALCGGAVLPAFGGQFDDELKRYDYEVEYETIKRVREQLTPFKYAMNLGPNFTFPVMPPARSVDEVYRLISEEVSRLVEEKYPKERRNEIREEAFERFRLYKRGETVSISAKIRSPEYEIIEGLLHVVTQDMVKISDYTIPLIDIRLEDRAHFDRDLQEAKIDNYIYIETRKFDEARTKYERSQEAQLTNYIFRRNNYLKLNNNWKPTKAVFDLRYEAERQKLYTQVKPQVQREIYMSNRWTYNEETQEWIPPWANTPGADSTPIDEAEISPMEQSVDVLKGEFDFSEDGGTSSKKPDTTGKSDLFDDAPAVDDLFGN